MNWAKRKGPAPNGIKMKNVQRSRFKVQWGALQQFDRLGTGRVFSGEIHREDPTIRPWF